MREGWVREPYMCSLCRGNGIPACRRHELSARSTSSHAREVSPPASQAMAALGTSPFQGPWPLSIALWPYIRFVLAVRLAQTTLEAGVTSRQGVPPASPYSEPRETLRSSSLNYAPLAQISGHRPQRKCLNT